MVELPDAGDKAVAPPWRRPTHALLRISRPAAGARERAYVEDVLASGWWGYGPVCRHLERQAAELIGSGRNVLAVSSCTAALHLALAAAGVGLGDEVIVPAITYVATAAAVRHAGAVPVFADVDPASLMLTAATVEPLLGPRVRAVIPVHYAGVAGEFDPVRALVAGRGIAVVEDAAHALGALRRDGRPVGAEGAFACFSFAPTKPLASISGGLLVFDDPDLAGRLAAGSCLGLETDTLSRFETRGLVGQHVQRLGWHYRANDMAAAIAVAQMERLEEIRSRRAGLEALYREGLADLPGVQLLPVSGTPCWYLMAIRVAAERRDPLRLALREQGVDCGIHYSCLLRQPLFAGCRGQVEVADREAARIVTLPLHEGLVPADVVRVCGIVRSLAA